MLNVLFVRLRETTKSEKEYTVFLVNAKVPIVVGARRCQYDLLD